MAPYKMEGAVDSVRAAWAQARAHAIEEGRPYRFAIVEGSGHFRVAPDDSSFWSGSGSSDGQKGPDGKPPFVREQSLPQGVRFSVSNGSSGSGSPSGPASAGPDDGKLEDKEKPPAPSAYTDPIVFLPDGSARDDAELVFSVRGARTTILSLRGLTGIVTVKHQDKSGSH
jgi:hypothetical protein